MTTGKSDDEPATPSEWTPSEAIYAFAGWLTSREERMVCSAFDPASPMAMAVKEFCGVWGLAEPRENWHRVQRPGARR